MKRVDPSLAALLLVFSTGLGHASGQEQAAVGGTVRDLHGIPQLGALVELLGPGSAVLAHTYTDDHGRYFLSAPEPGRYQLRTSAAFVLPVLQRNLRISAGSRTLANVTMSALFEAGNWFPVAQRRKDEPADDWQWTLRSSAARPLLRLANNEQTSASYHENAAPVDEGEQGKPRLPAADLASAESAGKQSRHGEVTVTSGVAGLLEDGSRETLRSEWEHGENSIVSMRASIQDQAAHEGSPAISLRTEFQHENALSHSQYRAVLAVSSVPEVAGAGKSGYQAMTLATGERVLLGDLVTIDAGTLLSAERLQSNRVSAAPFLRLVVHPVADLAVMYRFAGSRQMQRLEDVTLDEGQSIPLSDATGQPLVHPSHHQELALSRAKGRDVTTVAIYRDDFPVAALQGSGAKGTMEDFADLPVAENMASGRFVVATEGYTARGVSASWTHSFSAELKAMLVADFGTTLAVQGSKTAEIKALQDNIVSCSRPSLTADLAGKVPRTATTFEVRYRWQPADTLTRVNAFDAASDEAYATVLLKQRLWRGHQLRSVSAVLEASNLLEEGYQPVLGPDGETLFLAQMPRSVQAGLNFSF